MQPPLDTERSLSDRPNTRAMARETATAGRPAWPSRTTRPAAESAAMRCSGVNPMRAGGQAGAQSPQKVQRPRSMESGAREMAWAGQASRQAWQASAHGPPPSTGRPRNPRGLAARRSGTNCRPCENSTFSAFSIAPPPGQRSWPQ